MLRSLHLIPSLPPSSSFWSPPPPRGIRAPCAAASSSSSSSFWSPPPHPALLMNYPSNDAYAQFQYWEQLQPGAQPSDQTHPNENSEPGPSLRQYGPAAYHQAAIMDSPNQPVPSTSSSSLESYFTSPTPAAGPSRARNSISQAASSSHEQPQPLMIPDDARRAADMLRALRARAQDMDGTAACDYCRRRKIKVRGELMLGRPSSCASQVVSCDEKDAGHRLWTTLASRPQDRYHRLSCH